MNKSLISIVIPIYNVDKYLKKCIESVLNQTYSNLEIILVDDGSPDNCPQICDEYRKKDSRIKVIHKENGGLSDARNVGIDHAKGEYITFIDSDDYVANDYIEYLYNLIVKYGVDISCCSHLVVYNNGQYHGIDENFDESFDKIMFFQKMLYAKKCDVTAWAKLYKKDLFNDIRYPKGKIFEDIDTTYKLIDKVKKVACGYSAKYYYMIRKSSITTNGFQDKHYYMIDATLNMCDYLKKYPELENGCTRRICYAYISTMNRMINSNYDINSIKELRKKILSHSKLVIDNNCSFRERAAILILMFGLKSYVFYWNVYQKLTGRK